MTTGDFAMAVQQYCFMTGGSVTSFGRTTKHNDEVGGKPYSPHRFWRGMDVVYDDPVLEDIIVAREIAERCGLLLIREGDHDHLQPLGWKPG